MGRRCICYYQEERHGDEVRVWKQVQSLKHPSDQVHGLVPRDLQQQPAQVQGGPHYQALKGDQHCVKPPRRVPPIELHKDLHLQPPLQDQARKLVNETDQNYYYF